MKTIELRGRGPNTMSLEMLQALETELDSAGEAPLLITGAGEAFSSGLDLDALRNADAAGVVALLESMDRCVRRLFLHPAPTVAAVNGHAVAGGLLLAQCCDVRITTDAPRARFGMTGVALGLEYPPFVPAVFRARLVAGHAETVLLGAQLFGAEEALRLGLFDRVVAASAVQSEATAALAARASLPREAYASIKHALRAPTFAAHYDPRAFLHDVAPTWTRALLRRPG